MALKLCFEQPTGEYRWSVCDEDGAWITVRGIRCDVPLETRETETPEPDEPSGWMEPTGPARLLIDEDGYAHVLMLESRP